uniref:MFS domain-containing protein n=1 Tax=Caenorhabditis tropicalis TaxID=1561998 RepID=A0A1I7UUQ7_9PELO
MAAVASATAEKYQIPAISMNKINSKDDSLREEGKESESEQDIETDKKGIVIASLVMFIAAIENTVVGMSEWPYMNQIDKEADAQFFGNATAASKFFHAISALVFAVWCHRYQSFRIPLIAGRAIAFGACLLYLCVELFDDGRRYIMAMCYILFGVASSSSTILRAYVAAISSHDDRPQAYSGLQAATMISIIVGPLIQAAFSAIQYPGYEILPNVKFHIYSAPVWVAASTNFISVAIIQCCLKELPRRSKTEMKKNQSLMTFAGVKSRIEKLSQMNLNWRIIVLCWIEKMNSTLSIVTLTTLTSVIFMTNYGWSGAKTVLAMSITMGAVGFLAVSITSLYFFCHLGNYLQQRFAFLIGLFIFMSMYLFTYPWPAVSNPVPAYNATEDVGCNPEAYGWCNTSYAPAAPLLLIVIACVMGIGIPLSSVALDAIYSKTLGPINQSVMQGAMIVAEDVVLILGPIYSSGVYTHFGFESLWAFNGVIVLIGSLLWMTHLGKLAEFS